MQTRRLIYLFIALIALPALCLGYFSWRFIDGAKERLLQAQLDDFNRLQTAADHYLNQQLTDLLAGENKREYFEYQPVYVATQNPADQQSLVACNSSKLAHPDNEMVVGYFSMDSKNRVTVPTLIGAEPSVVMHFTVVSAAIDEAAGAAKKQEAQQEDEQQVLAYQQDLENSVTLKEYQLKNKADNSRQVQRQVYEGNLNYQDVIENLQKAQDQLAARAMVVELETRKDAGDSATAPAPVSAPALDVLPAATEDQSAAVAKDLIATDPVSVDYSNFEWLTVREMGQPERVFAVRLVKSGDFELRQGFELKLPEMEKRITQWLDTVRPPELPLGVSWQNKNKPVRVERAIHQALPASMTLQLYPADATALERQLGGGRNFLIGVLVLLGVLMTSGLFAVLRAVKYEVAFAAQQRDFIAAVSHELKTPLTGIRLLAEMLEANLASAPKQQEYYHTIVSESERLTRLIHNVLDMANIERGAKHFHFTRQDWRPLLERGLGICETILKTKSLSVTLDAAADLPPSRLDGDALVQVVVNLLDNAAKFSEQGGREKRVDLTVRHDNGMIICTVEDGGPGIPDGLRTRIFDRFQRGESEQTRRTQGVGLGLALVKEIVSAHGGSVTAGESRWGGAKIEIRIPAA